MKIEEAMVLMEPYLSQGDMDKVALILSDLAPVDIGEILKELGPAHMAPILQSLPVEVAGDVLNYVDPEYFAQIIHDLGEEKSAALLDAMYLDDVADILGELTKSEQDTVLSLMEQEDASDVRELMYYPEDTAGSLMTTEFVALNKGMTAQKAIDTLRANAPDAETVYYVYVVDDDNVLVGVLSLRQLIIASPDTLVEQIMRLRVLSVNAYTDQEEVAAVVSKYDLLAVPVVDNLSRLLGIITVDDIIDVLEEEATDDILRLGGANAEELEEEADFHIRIYRAVKSRLPWLLITLFGGLMAGTIMRNIEAELQAVVALAYFIPLLLGMGGNVGTQSSTVTVRGLSTGQINPAELFTNVLKEACVGFIVGGVCALLIGVIAYFWQGDLILSFVVGFALIFNMATAATVGTFVPLALKRVNVDPAVASAPFISTSIDVVGLLIYSILAALFIPMMSERRESL